MIHCRILLIMSLAALVTISGCPAKVHSPISIGINAWPGYEFLYLAQQKGMFAAEGVNVKLIEFGSLSDARRAFERGHLDGITSTMVEVLQAKHNSLRSPEVIIVADDSNGADVIMANAGIKHLKDLRGKRIAVEPASPRDL